MLDISSVEGPVSPTIAPAEMCSIPVSHNASLSLYLRVARCSWRQAVEGLTLRGGTEDPGCSPDPCVRQVHKHNTKKLTMVRYCLLAICQVHTYLLLIHYVAQVVII